MDLHLKKALEKVKISGKRGLLNLIVPLNKSVGLKEIKHCHWKISGKRGSD